MAFIACLYMKYVNFEYVNKYSNNIWLLTLNSKIGKPLAGHRLSVSEMRGHCYKSNSARIIRYMNNFMAVNMITRSSKFPERHKPLKHKKR